MPAHGNGFGFRNIFNSNWKASELNSLQLTPLFYFGFSHIRNSGNNQERIAINHLKKAEQHYQSAIEALDKAIEGRDAELSPELAAVFKKNLEIIDDSIRICKTRPKQSDLRGIFTAILV